MRALPAIRRRAFFVASNPQKEALLKHKNVLLSLKRPFARKIKKHFE